MFEAASVREKAGNSSDLIPYWGLQKTDDMIRIERIVPMYPFSRDELAYERLIKILSMYRLTLGQARQEELLEYLFKNCDNPEDLKELFINLSPYYRKSRVWPAVRCRIANKWFYFTQRFFRSTPKCLQLANIRIKNVDADEDRRKHNKNALLWEYEIV